MIYNRAKGQLEEEIFPGKKAIELLYGEGFFSKTLGRLLAHLVANTPLFSKFYGTWQEREASKKHIAPFIKKYDIDPEEFANKIEDFTSFQDFFIRELKSSSRPLHAPTSICPVLPADARYRFYQHVEEAKEATLKGAPLFLKELLHDEKLAQQFAQGSMIAARLSPMDCHRFLFPCAGMASMSKTINGALYSVNPQALKWNASILSQNIRTLCVVQTGEKNLGDVLVLEIGATNVGSIQQLYQENALVQKGELKGLFSFGGSAMVILFEKGRVKIDQELLEWTKKGIEVKALMGSSFCSL